MNSTARRAALLLCIAAFAACGGDDPVAPVVPPGSAVAIGAGNGQDVTVGLAAATPLSVTVTDSNGAPISGVPVSWSIGTGGGSVAPAGSTTDGAGVASTVYTAGTTTGPKQIIATVPGAAGSPVTFTVTALAGTARRLVKTAGDLQTGNVGAFPAALAVTAVDTFGNGVPGVSVAWAVTAGAGSVAPQGSTTNATGVASTQYTAVAVGAGSVTASAAGLTGSPIIFTETAVAAIVLTRTLPVPANYGLHDQFVRAGLAFLCSWDTGLQIYDVGDGRAGGSPGDPRLVSTFATVGGQAHNAWWYWAPNGDKKYVFVGEEGPGSIGSSSSGDIHVVDVTNMAVPQEVAFFSMPGAGTHNFWVDEPNEILYAAYYNGGVVALNISGTLTGNLSSRVIANVQPGGAGNTFVWGVQLYNGSLYATDMLSGFWQLNPATLAYRAGGANVPERFGSDQWVANGFAYSGTWGLRGPAPGVRGNALKIWQLNGTGAPVPVDSIVVAGAGTISDVEVSADNRMLMFSVEGGSPAGVHFYSLVANPARPTFIASYAVGTGVHTATFAEIGGRRYAFAAKNPSSPALLILDVTAINP